MNIPVIRGIIDRRILVNYRVDRDVLTKLLPEPFRPKLVDDVGVAGVCLIRLNHIRPTAFPAIVGISSENAAHHRVVMNSDDGETHVAVEASVAQKLPAESVFDSLEAASGFFEKGSVGYAPSLRPGELHALELRSIGWRVQPMDVERVESSFFGDAAVFPVGSVEFDCALLMRTIDHEWHVRKGMATDDAA